MHQLIQKLVVDIMITCKDITKKNYKTIFPINIDTIIINNI